MRACTRPRAHSCAAAGASSVWQTLDAPGRRKGLHRAMKQVLRRTGGGSDVLERPYRNPPWTPIPPPPPLPMFEADSQNFASALSVLRGFKLQIFLARLRWEPEGDPGRRGVPAKPLFRPLQTAKCTTTKLTRHQSPTPSVDVFPWQWLWGMSLHNQAKRHASVPMGGFPPSTPWFS